MAKKATTRKATAKKATVDEYIAKLGDGWQADVCRNLRKLIHREVPGVDEQVKWGSPHYTVGKEYVCLFFAAKKWVNFTLFNRDRFEAPDGLFEVTDYPDRGTLKIKEGATPDYELLARLVRESAN